MLSFVSISLSICGLALLLHAVGAWATRRQVAREQPMTPTFPALSLLKPIKGSEEELEQNLRSFFEQDYPAALCVVFASTDPDDPGMHVARGVARQYPHAQVEFVCSDPSFGHNPKVSNLARALDAAEHDLVLQTDANVRLRPGYLRAVVAEFLAERASLLGALVAGTSERTLGAALENVQLTTFITPGICLAYRVFGIPCVIGKSIMFRKAELNDLGGLARVKDVLAEDFVLGQVYQRAGKRVALSRLVVENVNRAGGLGRFAARHARWLQMRVVVHVVGFAADLFSNAACFALFAAAWSGEPSLWAWYVLVVLYKGGVDAWLMRGLRGHGLAWRHVLCYPLRDLLQPALWLYALFTRTTEWRGARFRLTKGSRLIPVPTRAAATPINALAPSSSPNPAPPRVEHRG